MQIYPELITRCLKNDRKSQFELYHACYGFMMGVCHRYTNSHDDAKALVNGCFLKILNNLDKFKTDTPFEPWVKRIMINTIIDEYRKNIKQKETMQFEEPEKLLAYDKPINLDEAEKIISTEQIETFLKKLPEMSRRVFNLFAVDGYSHKEIATMLHMSEGTSKWHVSTARERLKELVNTFIQSKKSVNV